jgi:hypothetical protein
MAPSGVRPRRHADLVEVVNSEVCDAAAQLIEHERLASCTRSEEQEEHPSNLAGDAAQFFCSRLEIEPRER